MDEPDFKKQRAQDFATRLVKRRVQKNFNQAELAARASAYLPANRSFSRGSISRYESGLNIPGPSTLTALAKALECEPSDLVPRGVLASPRTPLSLEADKDGNYKLSIDTVVPLSVAMQIIALLPKKP